MKKNILFIFLVFTLLTGCNKVSQESLNEGNDNQTSVINLSNSGETLTNQNIKEDTSVEQKEYLNKDYNYKASFDSKWKEVVNLEGGELGEINFQSDYIVLSNDDKSLEMIFQFFDEKNSSINENSKNDILSWYTSTFGIDNYEHKDSAINISSYNAKEIFIPSIKEKGVLPGKYTFLISMSKGLLVVTSNEKNLEIEKILNSINENIN